MGMPLFWLSLAWIAGIWLGNLVSKPVWWWLLVCLAPLPWLGWPRLAYYLTVEHADWLRQLVSRQPVPRLQWLLRVVNRVRAIRLGLAWPWLVFILLLGAARYQAAMPGSAGPQLGDYLDDGNLYLVEGVLALPPDERDTYTNLVVEVQRIRLKTDFIYQPVQGRLLARTHPDGNWRYGDRLQLSGELSTPFETETFSYRDYLSRKGIYSFMSQAEVLRLGSELMNPVLRWLFELRYSSAELLYALYPDPEASLLAGILLGIETGIPDTVKEAFQVTGTAHIVAISGFNITLLAGLFSFFLMRILGRWRGALFAMLGIGLYTVLVGGQAPVVRAAILGGLSVLAAQIGRRQHGLNSLAFVSALMALFEPNVLWDIGFQLSVSATLGLVLYGESWKSRFEILAARLTNPEIAHKLAGPIGEYVLMTLAAQLLTLPVIAYHFQRLSLVSLLANPVILPLQPALMVIGGGSLLAAWVWMPLGRLVAWAAWPLALITIRSVEFFAGFPQAELRLPPINEWLVVGFYLFILGWTFLARLVQSRMALVRPGLALGALILLTVQVWRGALAVPDSLLHLALLDVNPGSQSGEALWLQTPQGSSILINGGPSPLSLSDELGRRIGQFHPNLDYLVIGGVGDAQLAALPEVIGRYPPRGIVWAGGTHASRSGRELYAQLLELGLTYTPAQAGLKLDLGENASLRFLAVTSRGAVLLLEWGKFRALLPLGMDFQALETLEYGRSLGTVSALLLADGGTASLNPSEWISNLKPQVILLSVAAKDAAGLPDSELLQILQGYNVLRTDRHGTIELLSDGQEMWVVVENP